MAVLYQGLYCGGMAIPATNKAGGCATMRYWVLYCARVALTMWYWVVYCARVALTMWYWVLYCAGVVLAHQGWGVARNS